MKKKGKGCLIWFGCFIGLFVIYLLVPKERVYKIPNRDLYVRVKVTPISDFGYIYLGKDSISVFQTKDYLKLGKAVDNLVIEMFLKTDNDTIYYIARVPAYEMEQNDYTFIRKRILEPYIFVKKKKGTSSVYNIKPEFTTWIRLVDFNSDLSVTLDSTVLRKQLMPIE